METAEFNWYQHYIALNPKLSYSLLTNYELGCLDSAKPMLVCIHGWLDNAASFTPLAEYLNDYNLLVIELAGHGYSSHRPEYSHYHLIDWVYDIWQVFNKLEINSCYLLGHSMGGMISAILSAILPQTVNKLILLESSAAFTSNEEALVENMQAAFNSRHQQSQSLTSQKKLRNTKAIPALIQTRALASEINFNLARLLIERNIEISETGFSWRSDPRVKILSPIRLSEAQANAYIKAITAECLVILGEQGYPSIKRTIYQRQSCFKQIQIESASGNHHFHMQNPALAAELINRFIRQ